MFLKKLLLRNFRNYSSHQVDFSPAINVICGSNGVGKTNLIEAIYLLSTGRSFRSINLKDLIKDKASFFYLEAEIVIKDISHTIKIYFDGKNKKIHLNSNEIPSFTSLLGTLCSSLITSDDFNLINGKPQIRRNFLNMHLAQETPLYVHHYLRFMKALKQRNYLLKSNKHHLLKVFDLELCKSGSFLIHRRNQFIDSLQDPLNFFLNTLFKLETNAKIKYFSTVNPSLSQEEIYQHYLEELQKNKKKESDFKTTLVGPHRDDFNIMFNKKSAKQFASEGQKKLLLFSLKFAQWQLLSNFLEQKALFLIDDFDAHLDELHKNNLKKALDNLSQVFITLPKMNEKFENANIIPINN
ncbi:MAG: DNA replication/repair protein RecF [Parachlamydiales bacterium]|jgi:DNA replication and repair protein RecF